LSHQTEADPISLLRPLLAALIEMKEDFLSALVAINKAKQSLGNYLATVPNSFPSFITAIRCDTCALRYHALRGLHRAIANAERFLDLCDVLTWSGLRELSPHSVPLFARKSAQKCWGFEKRRDRARIGLESCCCEGWRLSPPDIGANFRAESTLGVGSSFVILSSRTASRRRTAAGAPATWLTLLEWAARFL
jgi:hypothetical protein